MRRTRRANLPNATQQTLGRRPLADSNKRRQGRPKPGAQDPSRPDGLLRNIRTRRLRGNRVAREARKHANGQPDVLPIGSPPPPPRPARPILYRNPSIRHSPAFTPAAILRLLLRPPTTPPPKILSIPTRTPPKKLIPKIQWAKPLALNAAIPRAFWGRFGLEFKFMGKSKSDKIG